MTCFGITAVSDPYAPEIRLPEPLLSNPVGLTVTIDAAKPSICPILPFNVTRAPSNDRAVLVQGRGPSRRCSPNDSSWRPIRTLLFEPNSPYAIRRSSVSRNGAACDQAGLLNA